MGRLRGGWLAAGCLVGVVALAGPALAGKLASAKDMVNNQRYFDAIPVLENFTTQFPDDPDGWKLLADCYENVFPPRVDDENHALSMEERAETDRAGMLQTFRNIGSSAMYAKLVADDPPNEWNNLLLAMAYLVNDKDYARAKPVLDHLAEIGVDPSLSDPYHDALGVYDMGIRKWDDARRELNSAVHGDTSDLSLALLQQADKLQQTQQGQVEAQENAPATRFKQLLAGAQGFIADSNNVAAVDLLQDALDLQPGDPGAEALLDQAKRQGAVELYLQGKKLVGQKDYADAYDKFDKAIGFDPTNASASLALDYARMMLDKVNQPKVIMKHIEVPVSGPAR